MTETLSPFEALALAVSIAGGQSQLARDVGCTPGNISQLLKKRTGLSTRFVLKAEAATGVSRHLLDPDTYPTDSAVPLPADTKESVAPGGPTVACDRATLSHRSARA